MTVIREFLANDGFGFMKDGAPLKIEFSISLKRYGEDAKPGVRGIIQNVLKAI